ncbi:diguanylate cyclase (GGDEF) domain-containing protein [Mycolicibacterium fluoranthenivorans]|uniref:Diguanylate cyclase (GGDEF) domain-containing protein n=1 Tax=Mycolicibacterium fluoranthenivorans TaxID=258505 RepID=A0A1G4VS16_9MYCO|nr:diguanylate cyclase (GGDEF) domain-containing protein [Mycolicibacterium fluoranthenivorans]
MGLNAPLVSPKPSDGYDDRFTEVDYLRGMERLVHAVQELSLARSLSDIQRIVRTSARELIGCDGTTFVLRDNGMCYYADEDAIAPLWKGGRFPMTTCISGWVMLNRAAVVIPDIYADARIPHAAYRPTFVHSLVMVPIRTLDPVGAIGAYWAQERAATSREVSLLQALADSTSIAMENVRIYAELEQRVRDRTADLERANEEIHQMSLTDDLTGLTNRRGFYLLGESALRAARRNNHHCLLAYIDVDGLKQVNDELGHDAGDSLIADVGDVLRTMLRESDILARIGGDEFCVLVAEPGRDTAGLKDRVAEAFRTFNTTQARPYRLSASVGLALTHPESSHTLDELLTLADELMYADKKAAAESRAGGVNTG